MQIRFQRHLLITGFIDKNSVVVGAKPSSTAYSFDQWVSLALIVVNLVVLSPVLAWVPTEWMYASRQ
jgi:hypothetical protein